MINTMNKILGIKSKLGLGLGYCLRLLEEGLLGGIVRVKNGEREPVHWRRC